MTPADIVRAYKAELSKLGTGQSLRSYYIPAFGGSLANHDDLQMYIAKITPHTAHLRRAADLRQQYYDLVPDEDAGHRAARTIMRQYAEAAEATLAWYVAAERDLFNAIADDFKAPQPKSRAARAAAAPQSTVAKSALRAAAKSAPRRSRKQKGKPRPKLPPAAPQDSVDDSWLDRGFSISDLVAHFSNTANALECQTGRALLQEARTKNVLDLSLALVETISYKYVILMAEYLNEHLPAIQAAVEAGGTYQDALNAYLDHVVRYQLRDPASAWQLGADRTGLQAYATIAKYMQLGMIEQKAVPAQFLQAVTKHMFVKYIDNTRFAVLFNLVKFDDDVAQYLLNYDERTVTAARTNVIGSAVMSSAFSRMDAKYLLDSGCLAARVRVKLGVLPATPYMAIFSMPDGYYTNVYEVPAEFSRTYYGFLINCIFIMTSAKWSENIDVEELLQTGRCMRQHPECRKSGKSVCANTCTSEPKMRCHTHVNEGQLQGASTFYNGLNVAARALIEAHYDFEINVCDVHPSMHVDAGRGQICTGTITTCCRAVPASAAAALM